MKIKTTILLGILLTLSIFTMASCVDSTAENNGETNMNGETNTDETNGGDDGGDTDKPAPLPPSNVSAAKCADATAALNCFISKWDTTKTGVGASATNVVELPLVENGAYNFYVDWGDGTPIENITAKAPHTHEYKDGGEYTIHIAGEIKGWRFFVSEYGTGTVNDYGDAVKLLDVSQWGSLSLGNTDGRQFQRAENFNPTASDAPNLSETTSLAAALKSATVFNGAIGNWDVSTITTTESMFEDAAAFDQDLSKWNVSAVTNMNYMFWLASTFNSPLLWAGKTQNVTSMANMFKDAKLFDQKIGGWNVGAVGNMEFMFFNAAAFNQELTDWNVSAVTSMEGMFKNASTFNSPLVWKDKTQNVTTMASMFYGAKRFNENIGGWDVSNVEKMEGMFRDAAAFDQDLSKWNVCKVTVANRLSFHIGTSQAWAAGEKPNWGMEDCPTN